MKQPIARLLTTIAFALLFSIPAEAKRIVVLSTTAWDFVKELGLAADVVGRADNVEAPELKDTARVGRTDGVNLEALIALKPETVLGSPQYHGALTPQLAAVGAKLELISIKKWDDVPAQMERLATALGTTAKADSATKLAEAMKAAAAAKPTGKKVVVIVNAEPLLVATAGSYSADLIRLAGGDASIVPDAVGGQFRGFTQFSDEKLLELNPDIILLSRWQGAGQLETALASKPFWKALNAVKAGAVKTIPSELLYTVPGPRGVATVKELSVWFGTLAK
jgi:iron complex transport system substrate-binding protein